MTLDSDAAGMYMADKFGGKDKIPSHFLQAWEKDKEIFARNFGSNIPREEIDTYIELMSIEDQFEGWRAIGKKVTGDYIKEWERGDRHNLVDPNRIPGPLEPAVYINREYDEVEVGKWAGKRVGLDKEEWNKLHQLVKDGETSVGVKAYLDSISDARYDADFYHELDLQNIEVLIEGIKIGKLESL